MWQIVLLAIPLIMACNRNDSKPKPAESTPNLSKEFDMEDACSDKPLIIENSYSELVKLKQLLDGNKYSIRGNEIFVADVSGEDIGTIAAGSSFQAGIHFSAPIQASLSQLQGRNFYLCKKPEDSGSVSFHRFARHYPDLVTAKILYAGVESDPKFQRSFPKDQVACELKRKVISGIHDESGIVAHNSKEAHQHNVIQKELECVDLNSN